MRGVIQEISLDLKTGVSDVTVGAPEQISLQGLHRSEPAACRGAPPDGLGGFVHVRRGRFLRAEDPAAEAEALPERTMKSRSFPASGRPSSLQAQEPPAWGTSAVEVGGCQCRLSYGSDGKVSDAYIRQGKAIYASKYTRGGCFRRGTVAGGWVKSPVTSGEIWLKIQLDKDAKYLGSSLSAAGGVSTPSGSREPGNPL